MKRLDTPPSDKWYQSRSAPRRKLVLYWALASAPFIVFSASPAQDSLDLHGTRRVEYVSRALLDQTPAVSERIRILAFDDKSADVYRKGEMQLLQFAETIRALDKVRPKAILIDKIFSFPGNGAQVDQFVRNMKNVKTPVYVGAFASSKLSYREPADLGGEGTDLLRLIPGGKKIFPSQKLAHVRWLPKSDTIVYSAEKGIIGAFSGFGLINHQGHGNVPLLSRIGDKQIVPHIALRAADELRLDAGGLFVNGAKVPLDTANTVQVNLLPAAALYAKAKNVSWFLAEAKNSGKTPYVHRGDIVLILPSMFTGNLDIKDTPAGTMPGGFVIAALLNTVLGESGWIRPIGLAVPLTLLACAVALLVAALLPGWAFGLSLPLLALAPPTIGVGLFVWFDVTVSWLTPAAAILTISLTVFAHRARLAATQAQCLKVALDGIIPAAKLDRIINAPELVLSSASEQVVTIMFVDLVGFSKMTELATPAEAFRKLQRVIGLISDIVHEFDGIIDKCLGDGVLAYFGLSLDNTLGAPDHADRGLEAAIKIQLTAAMEAIKARELGAPVFPMRIGLNTAAVYVGDVGGSNRIEFTCIGNGVNLAQRYESACDPFKIIIGSSTKDLLMGHCAKASLFHQKFIRIKHQADMATVWEADPFGSDRVLFQSASRAYQEFANLLREEKRMPFIASDEVFGLTEVGKVIIHDHSKGGLLLSLPMCIGRGVELRLTLMSDVPKLKAAISEMRISSFTIEIRWSWPVVNGLAQHGVSIKGLTSEERAELFTNIGQLNEVVKAA